MPQSVQGSEKYHDILDQAPIGTLIHDLKAIRYMNRFLLELLGYDDLSEVAGRPVLSFVHPDSRKLVAERIFRIETYAEVTPPREVQMLCRDGSIADVEASGFPVQFAGEPAVQVIMQDISRRKQAELEIHRQKEDFEHILSKVQGIVWRADARTFQFNFVGGEAEAILGYPASAWLESPTFWADHIHPEDRAWAVAFCVSQTGAVMHHEFEYRMIAADGRTVWLRDTVSVVAENGVAHTLYGLMTDISLTKKLERGLLESETRYRVMAENSTDIIAKFAPEGKITYVSPSVERILGITPGKVMQGGLIDIVHPEDRELVLGFIDSFKKDQQSKVLYRCKGRGGKYIWLEAAVSAICHDSGEVDEYLIHSRDVTERKKLEDRLQQSHEMLRNISSQTPGILFKIVRDPQGKYTVPFLSETAKKLAEVDPYDSGGVFDLIVSRIHPDDKSRFMATIEKSGTAGQKFSVEYRTELPTQGLRWRRCEAQPEISADGSVAWYGHITDITESKLMQDALSESEARSRLISENSPIGIYMVNEHGQNVFTNKWFQETQGIDLSVYTGEGWATTIHSDDLPLVGLGWTEFWDHDIPFDMEYRVPGKNGRTLIFHAIAKKLYQGKKLIGAVGIVEDITEKKQFADQVRSLSSKIIDLRERERAEISRDLHDSVGQNLVLLKLRLQSRMENLSGDAKEILAELLEPVDNVLATSREIALKLSPAHLRTLGLCLAIEDLCDQIRKIKPLEIELDIEGLDEAIGREYDIQLYRILQESMTNILKHSDATRVRIRYEKTPEKGVITISDNGSQKTAPASTDGIGLQIMRERARVLGGSFNFIHNQFGAEVTIEIGPNPL